MPIIKILHNNKYSADDLFQWDRDQVLTIFGLSLTSIPEVHFATSTMNEAIVKQASMDRSGVISVAIPNVLLEGSAPINVYISGYEDSSFKTWYKMELKVKARTKPADFVCTEDDEEVFSFNALENKLDNTIRLITMSNEDLQKEIVAENENLRNKIVAENENFHTEITEEVTQKCETAIEECKQIVNADRENLSEYAKGEGITFSVVDEILCVTYDDGIEEGEE